MSHPWSTIIRTGPRAAHVVLVGQTPCRHHVGEPLVLADNNYRPFTDSNKTQTWQTIYNIQYRVTSEVKMYFGNCVNFKIESSRMV